MSDNAEELRQRLKSALDETPLSFSKILELSNALSLLDPDFVRFTVDASHLNRIGQDLVAKKETALAEIVKNAYDADATAVDLTFADAAKKAGGKLEVWDNGTGMSRQSLIDGFMRLSSPDKVDHPVSPRFGRSRAGRKGIGRFAVQRLGEALTIVTQTKENKTALEVHFEWNRFQAHSELSLISTEIRERRKTRPEGTDLIIHGLREAWSDDDISQAHRYVAELLQPFPLKQSAALHSIDPGFEVNFHREIAQDILTVENAESVFFKYCDAEVNANVDEAGRGHWQIKSSKYPLTTEEFELAARDGKRGGYSFLKNVRCRAYYYIIEQSPKQARGFVRKFLNQNHGIRLYRNGFRVPPYGSQFDDWLGLDLSSRQRSLLPPHANLNFVGFVEVPDPEGELFEETSSREGLIETPAFVELREFVSSVLKLAVQRVAQARGTKVRASDARGGNQGFSAAAASIARDLSHVRSTVKEASTAAEVRQIRDRVLALGRKGEELLQENATIRVLASMGLTISEFTHEVEMGFVAIEADLSSLNESPRLDADSKRRIQRVLKEIDVLHSYVGYFETTAKENINRDLRVLEIGEVLRSFESGITARKQREQIELEIQVSGYDLFTRPMHPSEWASILLNFFTNSLKAIRRARIKGQILVNARRESNSIVVEFLDNGDGIASEIRQKIFDPFFTTTNSAFYQGSDDTSLEGMGLGLSITRDIVESAGGKVELVQAPSDYSTCFRVEIPAATPEEIRKNAH